MSVVILSCRSSKNKKVSNVKGTGMAKKKLKSGEWSKAEVGVLKKMFPVMSTLKIATKLNRSLDSVTMKAREMKLKKSAKYLKSIGRV